MHSLVRSERDGARSWEEKEAKKKEKELTVKRGWARGRKEMLKKQTNTNSAQEHGANKKK